MKLSLEWLSALVTMRISDPEEIARAVTASIAEVDEVEAPGTVLKNCCVGEVLSLEKHPDADRLNVCMVQTDRGTKKVVCGGTNVRVHMHVAFAHVGATVRWHGGEMMELKPVKIRGVESEGMICAAEELGLEEHYQPKPSDGERPIMDLPESTKVGATLEDTFGTDAILHVDNHAITHRADLFSHLGFVRELVANGIATGKKRPKPKKLAFSKAPLPFRMAIEEKKLMPRYCGCLIEIAALGKTPDWMKRRLAAVGFRSINLPIDITNYVASEVGVPLHSFDADDLRGTVHMRTSKKGETIVTLDKEKRTLPDGALVLSDDEGIFDLLGIMGGLRSSTKETTRRIYLHSASLDPVSIRRTVIATGHRTDAATVYEKGVPHVVAEEGFLRAVELFLELVPGARIISKMESVGDNGTAKPINVSVARVASLLGKTIPVKEIRRILESLGCKVSGSAATLKVTPPLWRLQDLKGEHDLLEEIGRIHGYDSIEPALPAATVAPPARDGRLHIVRDSLQEEGCIEILPLSLTGKEILMKTGLNSAEAIAIANPLGDELSLLQTSLLPALLSHAGKNLAFGDRELATFSIGTVFARGPNEHTEFGLLLAQKLAGTGVNEPFLRAKQRITDALSAAGWMVTLKASNKSHPSAHPGRSAELFAGDHSIGMIFEIHPSIAKRFDLPARAAAVLLDCTALLKVPSHARIAKALPLFPAVSYDVTLSLTPKIRAGDLLMQLRASHPLLESVETLDLYAGQGLPVHTYRLTIRATYRASDRTLTEADAGKAHAEVLKRAAAHGAEIR